MSLVDHAQEMAELYAEGYSMGEIAEKFGSSRQRVHQLIGGTYERAHYGMLKRLAYRERLIAAHARIRNRETRVDEEALRLGIKPSSLKAAFRLLELPLASERPPSPKHGTYYRYQEGCRCNECSDARRAYTKQMRARGPRTHGTASAYGNFGCRCDECRRAGSIANRLERQKRKERRRLTLPRD